MKFTTSSTLFLHSILLLNFAPIFAQNVSEKKDTVTDQKTYYKSLHDFVGKSDWKFHSRSFFMSTTNEGNLKDDFSLAQGAGIGLLTAPIKGFQFGVTGYFIFNIWSSDLLKLDPTTGGSNRYELGLYDITNPTNKYELDRLEEFIIRYSYKKSSITVGRMELQTPFINPQDGRMRPTLVQGAWLSIKENKKYGINAGYVWKVSPRSTVSWYHVDESIGINPQGLNTDGTKSNYKGNLNSDGIAILNVYFKPTSNSQISIWENYCDNLVNSVHLEIKNEIELPIKKYKFYQGLMFIHQDALGNGGNLDPSKTYINKGAQSNTISAQVGIKNAKLDWNINFTHITNDGRYLQPREWGREMFYTFMPRERNEGLGNLNAINTNFTLTSNNQRFKNSIGYGYFNLPAITNYKVNKYSLNSYHQVNISSNYTFQKFWKGIEVKFLAASKFKAGNETLDPKYIYNKLNLVNFNLIVEINI